MSSFSKETSSQTFNLHSKKSNNPLGQSPKPHQLIISPTSTIRHSSTLIDSTDEDPSTPRFSAHSDDYFNQSDLIHSSSETHPINSPSSINQSIQDEPFHPITIHSPDPLPLPTHFVSGASRRLPELQQQLHLNPESIPELNPPTELDPLLSFTSDRLHPPSLQSQSQLHPHLPLHNPHSHPLSSPSPLHHPSRQPNPKSHRKIGTFDGVYLPTILSIFNVIYFLRFGYCIGQIGLLATISLLLLAYAINTLTVFSLSAIATNGQVRGGGAYYLISRTLGPEFGGSIGILFCLSQALTAAMNIIGFVESLIEVTHDYLHPQSPLPLTDSFEQLSSPTPTIRYFIKSLALLFATISCITLGRTTVFTSMARSMATILLLTLISILFSFLQKTPFQDPIEHFTYTGFSFQTFQENLYPSHLTKLTNPPSSFISPRFSDYQTVFGVLFPSVSGILAGSSLSGELRKPSKSLPQGMLWALVCVIIIYVLSLLGFSLSCGRDGLIFLNERGGLNLMIYKVSEYKPLIGIGVLLGSIFSSIMGITVCGKILQAISRDGLIPILKPFFSQGSQIGDDPIYSILFCYLFCQLALLYNINKIAIHITTISLLIFACINLACFTLRVSGSPNFRPSFRLFSEWTALLGLLLAFVSMYAVDPVSASTSLIVMMVLFVVIHYSSPAKQWGEVTQSIIYHQVRKYLLRLDERKDNVKYWRPQVLLFTNDPRHDWNQIVFCNSLKKGGLYVLAHIIKSEFSSESIRELQEQQLNWLSLVDISNIKAFVDITLAPDERVGARHLLLTSGLGGMRPNICMLGFPTNLKWRRRGKLFNGEDETVSNGANERRQKRMKRRSDSSLTVKGLIIDSVSEVKIDCLGSLPTDSQRSETPIKPIDFVGIIEDSLSLNKSVGLTYGFEKLRLPSSISKPQSNEGHRLHISTSLGGLASASFGGLGGNANGNGKVEEEVKGRKRWIDLWPILRDGESGWETYTMVLQLGMILSMVPSWRSQHTLRVESLGHFSYWS
ncbi:amino acid permease-domain-containing protein [Melampsora americana]|nr:amino acid permease-domain-containing protein [Melampsora americana]